MQYALGQGFYTAQTASIPSSVGFSQINGTNFSAMRAPIVMLASSTM